MLGGSSASRDTEERRYEVPVNEKSAAVGEWNPASGTVEIIQMRGNFWKTCGYSASRKNYLHPEEALILFEKGHLIVRDLNHCRIPFSLFYEDILRKIPFACYLAYLKLKSLEYIVFRHVIGKQIHCFKDDNDVLDIARSCPQQSLLDLCCCFKVYTKTFNWSKKCMIDVAPAGLVIVVNGADVFSGRLIAELLCQAKGIPIICAAVMSTGFVLLEEFTDALTTLDLSNCLAVPISHVRKPPAEDLRLSRRETKKRKRAQAETDRKYSDNGVRDNSKPATENGVRDNSNHNVSGQLQPSDASSCSGDLCIVNSLTETLGCRSALMNNVEDEPDDDDDDDGDGDDDNLEVEEKEDGASDEADYDDDIVEADEANINDDDCDGDNADNLSE